MRERGPVKQADVMKVLTSGYAVACEPDIKRPDQDRITMRGKTIDNTQIDIVFVCDADRLRILVITVMD